MYRPERSRRDQAAGENQTHSGTLRATSAPSPVSPTPSLPSDPNPDRPAAVALTASGDPDTRVSRREVLILATGVLFLPAPATALPKEPFRDDARLRQKVTVRVRGMPIGQLLQRLAVALGVHLSAEGEDLNDQKINLFARDLTGAEVLDAIANLLNSEGPKGHWWERSGRAPNRRYRLVRDLASRQWEVRRAAEAEARLVSLLGDRLRALRNEPFRPDPNRPRELRGMRKLLGSLSDAELAQLASDRFLILSAFWDSGRSSLWKELSEQAVSRDRRRDPDSVERKIVGLGPADLISRTTASIRLYGDPVRYRLLMGVRGPAGSPGMADICQFSDPLAAGADGAKPGAEGSPARAPAVPATVHEPVLALSPRQSWLMGDVLADLAARANVNLIADDYTVDWSGRDGTSFQSGLARLEGPQPLSVWLTTIQEEFGFAVAQDGALLRLRNRRWWLDRGREVPERLLARWTQLVGGTPDDRIQAAVEIAHWAPFFPGSLPRYRIHLGRLADRPEMKELSTRFSDPGMDEIAPGFAEVVSDVQAELHIYALLSPSQQQAVRGKGLTGAKAEEIDTIIRQQTQREQGLTLSWQDMPPAARELFARRVRTFWEPGIDNEHLRRSSLWLRFENDNILCRYLIAGVPQDRANQVAAGQGFILHFAPARPLRAIGLVGLPAPELQYEDASGKVVSLQPRGPLLLYLAPAWPRPVVTCGEEFADLRTLQARLEADAAGRHVLVLGTDASAVELQGWWRERGLSLPPLALEPESARLYGVRSQPVAVVVGADGTVTWAKEGFSPGDEEDWRRQLRQVGG
jgi:hypothetical protein